MSVEEQEHLIQAVCLNNLEEVNRKIRIEGFIVDLISFRHNNSTLVMLAAKLGHLEIVRTLIRLGANLELISHMGKTVLHHAVESNKSEVIQVLIDAGANINAKNQNKRTPLQYAVVCDKQNAIKCLMENGADLNDDEESLICHCKDVQMTNYFIEQGVDVNVSDQSRSHCFSTLITSDKYMHILMKHGIDYWKPSKSGSTPLFLAAKAGNIKLITTLIHRKVEYDSPDDDMILTMFHSCRTNNISAIETLLSLCSNLGRIKSNGETALISALMNKKILQKVVDVLLELGSDVDVIDSTGKNALHYAILSRERSLISQILQRTSNVNLSDQEGNTPLHLAAQFNFEYLIEILLEQGCMDSINVPNRDGKTCLMIASLHGNPETIRALLKAGADPNIVDDKGKNAAWFAKTESTLKCFQN